MGSVDDLLAWFHSYQTRLKTTEFLGVLPDEVQLQHEIIMVCSFLHSPPYCIVLCYIVLYCIVMKYSQSSYRRVNCSEELLMRKAPCEEKGFEKGDGRSRPYSRY